MAAGHRQDVADGLQRPNPPPAEIRRLLDRHESRSWSVTIRDANRLLYLRCREDAAVAVERPKHRAGELCGPAGFRVHRMRGAVEDHLVAARPHVQTQGDLVAHRAGRHEDRGLVPKQRGDPLLQLPSGGVEAPLLVADRGRRDRRSHALGGARLGIAVEVDRRQRSGH